MKQSVLQWCKYIESPTCTKCNPPLKYNRNIYFIYRIACSGVLLFSFFYCKILHLLQETLDNHVANPILFITCGECLSFLQSKLHPIALTARKLQVWMFIYYSNINFVIHFSFNLSECDKMLFKKEGC
jgi:hypothetical protein